MRIGYVCTNYNNTSYTKGAIESLIQDDGHHYEIVVVDNKSEPHSARDLAALSEKYPNVDALLMPSNVGYFRGLNAGIHRLRTRHPDIEVLVIGNNDLVFPKGFGDSLMRNLDIVREHAVLAPDITTLDGVHQNPHVITDISKTREFIYDLYYSNYYLATLIQRLSAWTHRFTDRRDEAQHEIAQPIYQGHGSCYILGPKFFGHFSELWAPTFMMFEEFFLSKQLKDVGEQVYYEPQIRVTHHCHGSLENIPSRRRWEMARDGHREYRKYVKVFG